MVGFANRSCHVTRGFKSCLDSLDDHSAAMKSSAHLISASSNHHLCSSKRGRSEQAWKSYLQNSRGRVGLQENTHTAAQGGGRFHDIVLCSSATGNKGAEEHIVMPRFHLTDHTGTPDSSHTNPCTSVSISIQSTSPGKGTDWGFIPTCPT